MPGHDGVMKGWDASEVKAGKADPFKEKDFGKMPCLCGHRLSVSLGYQERQQGTSELLVSLSSMARGKQDIGLEGTSGII